MRRIILCFALFAILALSLPAAAIPNRPVDQQLLDICRDGNFPFTRALPVFRADVNAREVSTGITPLVMAMTTGEKDATVIPRKPDIPLSPASDEYAVIATILRNVGAGSRYTVFVQDTVQGKDAAATANYDGVPLERCVAMLAKDLPKALVRAYLTSTAPSEVIPADASISGIRFIRDADLEAVFKNRGWWTAFYKKYPKSNGYMHVSLPIFDGKHQQALVYISGVAGGRAGEGHISLYTKSKRGWREVKQVGLWVS